MKNQLTALITACCTAFATAQAATTEDFNYPTYQAISGQGSGAGWAAGGAWTGTANIIAASGSLLDPAGSDPTNSALLLSPVSTLLGFNGTLSRDLDTWIGANDTTLFLSFDMLKSGGGSGALNYAGFNLGSYFVGEIAGSGAWGIQSDDSVVFGPSITLGQPARLVVRMDFMDGADIVQLFVNPLADIALPGVPDAILSTADFGSFSTLVAMNYGSGPDFGAPFYQIDSIKIGAQLGDVMTAPEPSAALLLVCGAAVLAWRRPRGALARGMA